MIAEWLNWYDRPATHRHKKRGTEYTFLGTASGQSDRSADIEGSTFAVYVDWEGCLWVRPLYEFNDGRFQDLALSPIPPAETG